MEVGEEETAEGDALVVDDGTEAEGGGVGEGGGG